MALEREVEVVLEVGDINLSEQTRTTSNSASTILLSIEHLNSNQCTDVEQ